MLFESQVALRHAQIIIITPIAIKTAYTPILNPNKLGSIPTNINIEPKKYAFSFVF